MLTKTRTVYLIISYQVLTDQFLYVLLPAEQAAGRGGGLGLWSLPEEVSCVQSQQGRVGGGGQRTVAAPMACSAEP